MTICSRLRPQRHQQQVCSSPGGPTDKYEDTERIRVILRMADAKMLPGLFEGRHHLRGERKTRSEIGARCGPAESNGIRGPC